MDLAKVVPKKIKVGIKKRLRQIQHAKNTLTARSPKLLILVYHRVLAQTGFNPANTIVSQETFRKQVEFLAKKMPLISLSNAVMQCRSGKISRGLQAVLTFDDGYRDNYEFVFPFLRQKGVPAAFFLAADYVGGKKVLWEWELLNLLGRENPLDTVKIGANSLAKDTGEDNLMFASRIMEELKGDPEARREAIDSLKCAGRGCRLPDYLSDTCITWEQARAMSDGGMEIGAHGMYHNSLSRIAFQDAQDEILKSKAIIEQNTGQPCFHFAFPFGSKNDYNDALIECVRNAGYKSCLLNIPGYNLVRQDAFSYKRIIMDESADPRYLLG